MTTLILNNELNGIEIKFTEKPTSETLEALKANGFHWHRVKKLWYAKNTSERLQIAQTVVNGGNLEVVTKTESKKNTCSLSLWKRCKIDEIPVHAKNLDTKTIAKETREHIKERFPEIKFSCRIGSDRWAASNEVNFNFKSAPYKKDSVYFKAIEKYVDAWLWSYNYDNSDAMTDYFDRHFYEDISTYNFEETEPTENQIEDMKNFDAEMLAAQQAEEKRQKEAYEKRLIEEQKEKKEAEEKKKRENLVEIINHIKIVDFAENKKYIISGNMLCGYGKENNIQELQKEGHEKEESAIIKREIHFTDENIYNTFCEMFLYDFDFLDGFGGTGTLGNRVTDENYKKLNSLQRESVKWILWDCVAVYLNNNLKLIIDPEGYSYSRYVNIVYEYKKELLNNIENQEKENFYFSQAIAVQSQKLEEKNNIH